MNRLGDGSRVNLHVGLSVGLRNGVMFPVSAVFHNL